MTDAAKTPALSVRGVSGGYGAAIVVKNVDLTVPEGRIVAVLGKNGMGKTTLLKMIMGFLPLHQGEVHLFGARINGEPPYLIARRNIAFCPQEQPLFQDLTVGENLRLGLFDDDAFEAKLEKVGVHFPFLPNRLRQRAGTLSGGEQKMLIVARGLMASPRIMLIDEITEGLQPSVIERLAHVLAEQRRTEGTAILLIEQHVSFALAIADEYAVLNQGEFVDRGSANAADAAERINRHLSI